MSLIFIDGCVNKQTVLDLVIWFVVWGLDFWILKMHVSDLVIFRVGNSMTWSIAAGVEVFVVDCFFFKKNFQKIKIMAIMIRIIIIFRKIYGTVKAWYFFFS